LESEKVAVVMKKIVYVLILCILCVNATYGLSSEQIANYIYNGSVPGSEFIRVGGWDVSFSGVLSETVGDTTEYANKGYATLAFFIEVPPGGEIIFEASFDRITWESISIRSINNDIFQSKIISDGNFIGSIVGLPNIRFRTSSAGSDDGTITGVFARNVSVLEGIEFGNPPHRFGFTPIHVDASYTTQQTDTVIFTADADKFGVVTDFYIIVSGSTDCQMRIFDETDSSGNYIFKANVEVATNKNFIFNHTFVTPYVTSAKGNSWKITTSAACDIDLIGHGYQF
jgi:hypothetical protein